MLRPTLLTICAAALLLAGCYDVIKDPEESEATATPTSDASGTSSPDDANGAGTMSADEDGNADEPRPTAVSQLAPLEPQCGGEVPSGITPGESNPIVVESGGEERTLLVYVPSGYSTADPLPLVLNFHGSGGNASQQEQNSGFIPLAEQEGFLLATPDGVGDPQGWEFGLQAEGNSITFVEDLLTRLSADFCIDSGRVYSTGFSNGAFLSSALACAMPDHLAAVAGVGGVYFPGDACPATVPTLAFHGTEDITVPFDGGSVEELGGIDYAGIRASLAGWAELGGCAPIPYPSQFAEGASLEGYDNCDGGSALELLVLEGFGHEWPSAESAGVSAAEVTWEFFQRFGE